MSPLCVKAAVIDSLDDRSAAMQGKMPAKMPADAEENSEAVLSAAAALATLGSDSHAKESVSDLNTSRSLGLQGDVGGLCA